MASERVHGGRAGEGNARRHVRMLGALGMLALTVAACAPVAAPAPPPPPPPLPAPGAPTRLYVTANASGNVSLAWSPPVPYGGGPAPSSYVVTWRRVPTGSVGVAGSDGVAGGPGEPVGPQVIGGSDASTTTSPWTVMLGDRGSSPFQQWCGGTLIDPSWVLTAGHCIVGETPASVAVVTGHDTISSVAPGDQRTVASITTAPGFTNGVAPTNDAALLYLSTPVTGVAPLPLVTNPESAADLTPALILGWGCIDTVTDPTCTGSPTYPDHLQGASVSVLGGPSTPTCGLYGTSYQPASMLCAGVAGGGIDTCSGDSGGPLAITVGGHRQLAGLTSWGNGCASASYPGVYTRVSSVAGWIGTQIPDLGRTTVTGIGAASMTAGSLWSGDTYAFQVAAVSSAGTGPFGPVLDVVVG